jgi:protein-L-isoaspartate(D-aspartate) O-methyltransferase
MGHMLEGTGKVCGIEYIDPIMKKSLKNLMKDTVHAEWLKTGFLEIKTGDGWKGWPEEGPFNVIHVGAAAVEIPKKLVEQLASPGRMLCPVGPKGETQSFIQLDKDKDGKITQKGIFDVVYVPLVNPDLK